MGQWHTFVCPNCNYEKECSSGLDRGFYAEVKPMVCKECNELNNVAIGEFDDKNNHTNQDSSRIFTKVAWASKAKEIGIRNVKASTISSFPLRKASIRFLFSIARRIDLA